MSKLRLNDNEVVGLAVTAMPALLAATTLLRGDITWGWGGLTGLALPAALALAAAAALTLRDSGRGRADARYRVVHWTSSDGDRAAAARHEAGHLRAMNRAGYRNLEARIHPDGSGWARGIPPPDETPQESLAVSYAGGYAEGGRHLLTRPQCRGDMHTAHATRAAVPWGGRGRVDRDAHRLARTWTRTGLTRYSRPLHRTGHYRGGRT